MPRRTALALLLVLAACAPLAGASHLPPSSITTSVGAADCQGPLGTSSAATVSPAYPGVIPTTDNGNVRITLTGTNGQSAGLSCTFTVRFTGAYALYGVSGFAAGGISAMYADVPCTAAPGASCTASDAADWWVQLRAMTGMPATYAIELFYAVDVHDGLTTSTVGGGSVLIGDPAGGWP